MIDLHTDYVLILYEKGNELSLHSQISKKQLEISKTRVIFGGFSYDDKYHDTNHQLSLMLNQKDLAVITDWDYFHKITHSTGEIGLIIHLEGAGFLKDPLPQLNEFHRKGVRSLGLTHTPANQFAGGNEAPPEYRLSNAGKNLLKEALSLGMIIDLAHLNENSFWDATKIINKPLLVSHANAQDLCPKPRNLSDDQIKAIADSDGVMGLFFSSRFVSATSENVTLKKVVEHFQYVADLVGVDHIGVGSDFGGIIASVPPKDMNSHSELPKLFAALQKAGFSDEDIEKIRWKNAYRVIKQYLHNNKS